MRVKCECEIDHDLVGAHPAFHGTPENPSCQNFGTERLRSSHGTFTLCPPCAYDARSGGYYWTADQQAIRDGDRDRLDAYARRH